MTNTLSYFTNIAANLHSRDSGRNELFEASEKMYHNEWDLPASLKNVDWIRKVISTDPHDAIEAGVRVLSPLDYKIRVVPAAANEASKDLANQRERVLKYWLQNSSHRRRSTLIRDVVRSALLYDMVAVQVMPIDYQKKLALEQGFGLTVKQLQEARRRGPFINTVFNPKGVHVDYNDYGISVVYAVKRIPLVELIQFWGEQNQSKIVKTFGDPSDPTMVNRYVFVHDATTLNERAIWVTGDIQPADGMELLISENDCPPMWVITIGGSNLEEESRFQYKPMLASVFQAGQWDTQNVVDTLWVSELIATAAQTKLIATGPGADQVENDYENPGGITKVPSGTQVQPNPPRQMDQGLVQTSSKFENAMAKSTVSRILMGQDVPNNTQWATINLATQTALGSLKPPKEIAEIALGEICRNMMLWVEFMGDTIQTIGSGRSDLGQEYMIDPLTIDVDNLIVEVELTPDVPTDKLQRINAAQMAVNGLGYTREQALEDIGVTDPLKMLKDSRMEQLVQAMLQAKITEITGEAQAKVQALAQQYQMQIQMEAQQAQQMQQQAMQQQQNQMMPPSGMGGQGFNPAMGGQPPQEGNPEMTREGQTGMTQGGENVVAAGV